VKKLISILFLLISGAMTCSAQCAMCRATLENNVSNGNIGIAEGINIGILYLLFAPYTAVGVIAYLWYRTSKANERNKLTGSAA
jgi:hypothetical protein